MVSAVCHAPAALLPAQRPDGSWLFDGYQLTAFTNEEETQAGLADKAPWLLETRLRELGGKFSKAEAWSPYVVVGPQALHRSESGVVTASRRAGCRRLGLSMSFGAASRSPRCGAGPCSVVAKEV